MTDDTATTNAKKYFLDRASARTPEEREARYQDWLASKGLEDTPERRALHFRRYKRVSA